VGTIRRKTRSGWGTSLAPCAPEGRDGEVKEDQGYTGVDKEFYVVGALCVVHAGDPGEAAEDYDKKEEEDAGDFKHEDSANTAERLKEAADAPAETTRSVAGYLAGGAGCGLRGWLIGRGLGSGRNALAGDAAGNAKTDAECATDVLRFHSVYDGSSAACRAALPLICRFTSCRAAAIEVR